MFVINKDDLCFCGSGKIKRDCHPDITENSVAGKLLILYRDVDRKIQEHYASSGCSPKCHKGCDSCCSQYFMVNEIEESLIMRELLTWDKDRIKSLKVRVEQHWKIFANRHPELATELMNNATGSRDHFLGLRGAPEVLDVPCLFLDTENKSCNIYNIRPFICRSHGVSYIDSEVKRDYTICDTIGKISFVKRELYNVTPESDRYISLDSFTDSNKQSYFVRKYPILYIIFDALILHNEIKIKDKIEKFRKNESVYKSIRLNLLIQKRK